jgi:hydroxypyruvate isomerase
VTNAPTFGVDRLKPAANVSILFSTLPLEVRLARVAEAGFDFVEMWWPFPDPFPASSQVDDLMATLDRAGLQLAALNFYAGDMSSGDRGVLSLPEHTTMFRDHVSKALEIADRAGCRLLNALYGNIDGAVGAERQHGTALENLAYARDRAFEQGATVLVETVNAIDNPRYPITRLEQAAELIGELGGPGRGVALLFDIYHVQRTEGNLIANINSYLPIIRHVQLADSPGRTAPGTGEIAFERVLRHLAGSEYDGFVGLEYRMRDVNEGFGWIEHLDIASVQPNPF